MWCHNQWVPIHDPAVLTDLFTRILKEAGFNTLKFIEHHFTPQGWTAMWLLSESHFAIHTFPEHGKSYIELSSCILPHFQKFLELIITEIKEDELREVTAN